MGVEAKSYAQSLDRKTILLVEDDRLIGMAEQNMLEGGGYNVVLAFSGENAVATSRGDHSIDLALMDIDLGAGMDGTEAADLILRERSIPIVFMSCHTEPEIIEKTENVTSYGYVVKNTGITALDASIKMAFKLFESNRKLHLEEEHLKTTFHSIGDAVVSTDIQGNVVRMNEVAERLSGWRIEAAQGRPFSEVCDLVNSQTREPIGDFVQSAIASDKIAGLKNHTLLISKSGEEYQIEDSCAPIRDLQGRITGVVVVFRDITSEYALREKLRKSEEDYRRLFEEHSAVKLVIEIETGDIINANRAASEYYGWSCEELKSMNIRQISALPSDEIQSNMEKARSRDGAHYPTRHRKADGSIRNVEAYTNIIAQSGKDCLHSIIMDVTERCILEEELKRNNAVFEAFFAHSPGILNIEDESFHYLKTDSVTPTYFGLDRESIVGRSVEELAPDFIQEYGPMMRRVIESGETMENVELQSHVPSKGGALGYWQASYFPVPLPGEKTGIGVVGIDVSERKAAEAALRESESKLSVIVESMPVGISVVNDQHHVVFSNPALGHILGMTDEGLIHGDYDRRAYIHGDGTPMSPCEFASVRAINERIAVHDSEIGIVKEDGSRLWTSVSSIPVEGIAGWDNITFTSDVTSRKTAEEKVRTLLAEKELLLGEVHHRLKNNMSVIADILELQGEECGNETVKKLLADAASRINSMLVLYATLYQGSDFETVSLSDYLPDLVDRVIADFSVTTRVLVEKRFEDIRLDADRIQPLGIIINEILSNIMKYAFEGRAEGKISISARREDGQVVLEILDDGVSGPGSFDFANHSTFGMRLIGLLTAQLRGSIRVERAKGTKVVLGFRP